MMFVSLVDQEQLIFPEHLRSPPVFSEVLVAQSLVFSEVLVAQSLVSSEVL
jgi:hypothetical protein